MDEHCNFEFGVRQNVLIQELLAVLKNPHSEKNEEKTLYVKGFFLQLCSLYCKISETNNLVVSV